MSSPSAPLPGQPGSDSPSPNAPLCDLIVALLPARDPDAQWWTPNDVAPLFSVTPAAVLKHCRDLFPQHRGQHYRLNRSEIVRLVKRLCLAGKRVPSRAEVLSRLNAGGDRS